MTFGYTEQVWNGETCHMCGHKLHRECSKLDDKYFCCEECLGLYLVDKYEDSITWLDFKDPEEIEARMLEDKYDE